MEKLTEGNLNSQSFDYAFFQIEIIIEFELFIWIG